MIIIDLCSILRNMNWAHELSIIFKILEKGHPQVKHSFDTWKGAKNIGSKVLSVCRSSKCPDISGDLPILSCYVHFLPTSQYLKISS